MGFFQWAAIVLLVINVVFSFIRDGEQTKITYSRAITGSIIWALLLYCGGFFN